MRRALLLLAVLCIPLPAAAQIVPAESTYIKAVVRSIATEDGELLVELRNGPDVGKTTAVSLYDGLRSTPIEFTPGETVVLQVLTRANGTVRYLLYETYRIPSLVFLTVLFFGLGIVLAGWTGVRSMFGLSVSIAILALFVVPQIVAGKNPLLISLIGSAGIALSSIYLSHGFNRRTSVALCSTVLTLALSTVLAMAFVHFGKLFGLGSEEALFLQSSPLATINLQGLLLGGIIIGALGVLDDITTAQTAAIDELSKANTSLTFAELFAAGTSIGREHIASLINTLALAYVGTSLPLFLLFFLNEDMPLWVTLNSEFIAEEIIRTLVGSSTLLLAVPISTWIAAKQFQLGNHTNARSCGHSH